MAGATLTQVSISSKATVLGFHMFESLDAAPANVMMTHNATVNLGLPFGAPLAPVIDISTNHPGVSAFDGTIDFGGTSGAESPGLMNMASDMRSSTLAAVLAQFSGVGNVGIPASATSLGIGSGAGNLTTIFGTQAGVQVDVTYTFTKPTQDPPSTPGVPEPTSLALMGLAFGGLAALRAVKRRKTA